MTRHLIGLLALATIFGCVNPPPAPAPPMDMGISDYAMSRALNQGMTEAQVKALKEPNSISLQTCGTSTAAPWQCKVYHYGSLAIAFTNAGAHGWLVASWLTF